MDHDELKWGEIGVKGVTVGKKGVKWEWNKCILDQNEVKGGESGCDEGVMRVELGFNLQIFQVFCIFPRRIRMKLLSSIVFINFSININLFNLVETKFKIFKFSVLIQDRILETRNLIATQVKSYKQRILDIQWGNWQWIFSILFLILILQKGAFFVKEWRRKKIIVDFW